MSIYQQYQIEKCDVISLASEFNKIRDTFANNKIDYKDYNEFYKKYFAAVKDNLLGFDYLAYGYVLFNATVLTKTSDEQKNLIHQNILLGGFLAKYAQVQESKVSVNPINIYNEINTNNDSPVKYSKNYNGEIIDFPKTNRYSMSAK